MLPAALALLLLPGAGAAAPTRNILYIVYDDLRPDLSAYDVPFMHSARPPTRSLKPRRAPRSPRGLAALRAHSRRRRSAGPNIQRLADTGLVFERAYCQEAVCSPSRNSFATGRRPNSTKVWNFINHFRNAECPSKNLMRAGKPRTRS